MANLTGIVNVLHAKRRELLDQLDAIDKAIAALETAPTAEVEPPAIEEAAEGEADPSEADPSVDQPVGPTVLKPRRRLADSHKEAMVSGRRRARDAKEVAAGLAREMPDETFVPAISSRGEHQPPRLVKKSRGH